MRRAPQGDLLVLSDPPTLEQRLQNTPDRPLVRNMMNAIESLEESFGAMLDISRLDAGIVLTRCDA